MTDSRGSENDGFELFEELRQEYQDALQTLVLACQELNDPRLDQVLQEVWVAAEKFVTGGRPYIDHLLEKIADRDGDPEERLLAMKQAQSPEFFGARVTTMPHEVIEAEEEDRAQQLRDLAQKWKRGELN